ncbi:MAG: cytochrome b, partial [Acetobacter sp.]|nr:cytochrome b [Acetobacter sp.]
ALIFAAVLFFLPNLIVEAENYRPANPLHTPSDIEPEWYFLPFYAILQAVPSKFGGLVAAAGAILVLFFLPWLDYSPVRSARHRPACRIGMVVLTVSFLLLGVAGKHHVQGVWLLVGQVATLCYFLYFLALLPIVSRREVNNLRLREGDAA